jgi:proteasome lid subunit RPN8/RPN11
MVLLKKLKREIIQVNWKITDKCLDMILESAKSTYPKEFGGLLRVDKEKKDTIIEVVLLPGTISGNSHAIFHLHMMPIDYSIVGTVHSHPSYLSFPSKADLELFNKYGRIHIIASYPYTKNSWKAYDFKGEPRKIIII